MLQPSQALAASAAAAAAPPDPSAHLLLQFLAWVAARPRLYAETMEAWRTSCPRLPVWEDATTGGLVRLDAAPGTTQSDMAVRLTEAGEARLAQAGMVQAGMAHPGMAAGG